MVIISKGERFMNMPDVQFLNKEIRDVTPPPKVKRQDVHVVPGKKERIRRNSGGGHTAHPIFGVDDFHATGGEGIDDDDPFAGLDPLSY